ACPGGVLNAHPNGQTAGVQLRAQTRAYGIDLFWSGGLIGRRSALRQNLRDAGMGTLAARQGSAKHLTAGRDVAGRRAIVDQRVALLRLKELGDIGHTDLKFERRRNPVQRLYALALQVLPVL